MPLPYRIFDSFDASPCTMSLPHFKRVRVHRSRVDHVIKKDRSAARGTRGQGAKIRVVYRLTRSRGGEIGDKNTSRPIVERWRSSDRYLMMWGNELQMCKTVQTEYHSILELKSDGG
jgi:hypothetical protein